MSERERRSILRRIERGDITDEQLLNYKSQPLDELDELDEEADAGSALEQLSSNGEEDDEDEERVDEDDDDGLEGEDRKEELVPAPAMHKIIEN
jgi:hypothetical protein